MRITHTEGEREREPVVVAFRHVIPVYPLPSASLPLFLSLCLCLTNTNGYENGGTKRRKKGAVEWNKKKNPVAGQLIGIAGISFALFSLSLLCPVAKKWRHKSIPPA